MIFGNSQFRGYVSAHFLTVACEHHGLDDSLFLQAVDGFLAVLLDLIVDDDMPGILPVDGDVDDGSYVVAVVPLGTDGIHHLRVAYTYHVVADACPHAFTSYFFHVCHLAPVGGLVGESIPQGCADRVCGEVLHMGRQVKQLVLVDLLRMYGFDGKLSVGQRSRLVEYDDAELRQDIHIVGTLDEDALSRSASQTSEEGQGHADDQCAGTTHYEEHQGTVEPGGEDTSQKGGDEGQCQSGKYHHGGIDAREAGDESFAPRFVLAGMLHQLQDLGDRTLSEALRGAHPDGTCQVDAARDDLVALFGLARHAFTRQGDGVQ